MSVLTEVEKDVMEEMYFVISFRELEKALRVTHAELVAALNHLLIEEMISQLHFVKNDFEKLDKPDYSSLEKSSFVANKKGLLTINTAF